MHRKLLLSTIAAVATFLATAWLAAQEQGNATRVKDSSATQAQGNPASTADPAKPGPAHQLLAKRAGTWKMLYRVYGKTGKPPIELPATCELRMIFGGRFLKQDMLGEGAWAGAAGLGVEGYDNLNQKYFFNWVDSNSTSTITLTGTADDSGTTITYTGEVDNATAQTKGIKVRVVIHVVSNDQFTFEYFQTPPGGKEVRPFDITYTRK